MITHKIYYRTMRDAYNRRAKCRCEGWYLFGLIRLYGRQLEWPTTP